MVLILTAVLYSFVCNDSLPLASEQALGGISAWWEHFDRISLLPNTVDLTVEGYHVRADDIIERVSQRIIYTSNQHLQLEVYRHGIRTDCSINLVELLRLRDDKVASIRGSKYHGMDLMPGQVGWLVPYLRALPREVREATIWEKREMIEDHECDVVLVSTNDQSHRQRERFWIDMGRGGNVLKSEVYHDAHIIDLVSNVSLRHYARDNRECWLPLWVARKTVSSVISRSEVRKIYFIPDTVKLNADMAQTGVEAPKLSATRNRRMNIMENILELLAFLFLMLGLLVFVRVLKRRSKRRAIAS